MPDNGQKDGKLKTLRFVLAEPPGGLLFQNKSPPGGSGRAN
jgi:hypothetical protein